MYFPSSTSLNTYLPFSSVYVLLISSFPLFILNSRLLTLIPSSSCTSPVTLFVFTSISSVFTFVYSFSLSSFISISGFIFVSFIAPFISIFIFILFCLSNFTFSIFISISLPFSLTVLVIVLLVISLNLAYLFSSFVNVPFIITFLSSIPSTFSNSYKTGYVISSYPFASITLDFNFSILALFNFTFPLSKSIFPIFTIPIIPSTNIIIVINVTYFFLLNSFIYKHSIFHYYFLF